LNLQGSVAIVGLAFLALFDFVKGLLHSSLEISIQLNYLSFFLLDFVHSLVNMDYLSFLDFLEGVYAF
jgi:hypothetical protein